MVLAEQLAGEGRAVPPAYQAVYATVVRPGTPRETCAELAGAHQFRQRQTTGLEFWRWGQAYLEADPEQKMVARMKTVTAFTERGIRPRCAPANARPRISIPLLRRTP